MAFLNFDLKYILGDELGSGSFGSVYHAHRISDGEVVAIKVIPNSRNSSSETEIAVLKRTNHENITKYIDSYDDSEGNLNIVFEYADRGDLESMILNGHLRNEERDIWRILARLSGALSYLHTLQPDHILHRDLKPANILGFSLWKDKENSPEYKIQCKVGDFGIAKLFTSDVQHRYYTDTLAGTEIYMAPEVLRYYGSYSFPADIWSLGAVISFCCNKKHLFRTEDDVFNWIGQCPIPDHYSTELKKLVSRMLSPTPGMRPSATNIYWECQMDDRKEDGMY